MEPIKALLQPGRIGNLVVKNRIIYSSMSLRSTDRMGHLTDDAIESLVYRAKQEYSPGIIEFPGIMAYHLPYSPCGLEIHLGNREVAQRLAQAVKRVKINDVKVIASISARGTRQGDSGNANARNIGPSTMRFAYEEQPAHEMTVDEIKIRVQEFIDATCRAREAGFDGVLIHACSGKLISMFLSPYSNHRTDTYGGDLEGRCQFLLEILQGIRYKVGYDYPLMTWLGVDDLLGKYGLTLDEGVRIAKLISPYVDAIKPSTGTQEHIWNISVGYTFPQGYMLETTNAVKEAVDKPVIAMARLGNPQLAERAIMENKADFVALGRPLLVDPHWIEKAAKGADDIRPCIGCVNCMTFSSRKEIQPVRVSCTMNPGVLREEKFEHLQPAEQKKNILVVGGGLAGIEAALTLDERGHNVTLVEKTAELGGQWRIAAFAKHKNDYKMLLPYKKKMLSRSNIKVMTDHVVDRDYLCNSKPDEVVLATGAIPKVLPFDIPDDAIPIVQGNDVITGSAEVGERVVVIGARYIGLEVAAQLSAEGKDVSVVDMDEFGKGANPRLIGPYRDQMVEHGAHMYPRCAVLRVTDQGVDIVHMNSLLTLCADTVVLAIGTKPERSLEQDLQELNIPYYPVGDCRRIGDALYAIRDGAEIGRLL